MQAPLRVRSVVLGNPPGRERLSNEGEQEIICTLPGERLSGEADPEIMCALDSLLSLLCEAVKSKLGLMSTSASRLLQGVFVPRPLCCIELSTDVHTIPN